MQEQCEHNVWKKVGGCPTKLIIDNIQHGKRIAEKKRINSSWDVVAEEEEIKFSSEVKKW